MPGSPMIRVDLSNSFGAAFIGLVVCIVLFGLGLAQGWMYFWHNWNKDTKALKSFIACIIIMDTVHTVMIVYSMYWYLVLNFGNVEALAANKWFFIVQGNFGGIYSTAIQWYYARQIYLVGQKIFPVIIIVSMSLVGNALGFYTMAKQLAEGQVANRFGDFEWVGIFATAETVVVDVLITGSMCWALYRNKTGFTRTDSMIMTLMAYSINTGLLTTWAPRHVHQRPKTNFTRLSATAMTVTLSIAPRSLIPMAIYFPLGKCYVNSVLAMLNSRGYVRDLGSPNNSDNSFSLTSIRVVPPSESFGSKSKPTNISVIVHRSTALVDAQSKSDPNMARSVHSKFQD